MTERFVNSGRPTIGKYSDENIISNCSLFINTDFVAPELLKRYDFVFVKEFTNKVSGYSCQLDEAFSTKKELSWMVAGAVKALSTSKKFGRIIVLDIDSPNNLTGVQLRRSDSNNWHYDTHNPMSSKSIEEANPLDYTYFQNDEYFIAIRKNECEDIFMYVYKKK